MCILDFKSDLERFEGYKVVFKEDDHYYSPVSGILYELGPLPIPMSPGPKWDSGMFCDVTDPESYAYDPALVGRTSVFMSLEGAEHLIETRVPEGIIIKMEVEEDMWQGSYLNHIIISGRRIVSMSEDV